MLLYYPTPWTYFYLCGAMGYAVEYISIVFYEVSRPILGPNQTLYTMGKRSGGGGSFLDGKAAQA